MRIHCTPEIFGRNQNDGFKKSVPCCLPDSKPAKSSFLYSSKKAALAIGVSESSIKRWCDAGVIEAVRTAGGHRRVARAEVVKLVKQKKYSLREPVAIGLPDVRDVKVGSIEDGQRQFLAALRNGDESLSRKLLVGLFVDGQSVAELFDRIVAPAFRSIGQLRRNGRMEIYQERNASQACLAALKDVESMLHFPGPNAPAAIGAVLDGDQHPLSSVGVQMCLSNFGWKAKSLGANFSLDSLRQEVTDSRPDAVWISVSHLSQPEAFAEELNRFCQQVGPKVTVIVGGMAPSPSIRSQLTSAICCDSFVQLALLIRMKKNELSRGARSDKLEVAATSSIA